MRLRKQLTYTVAALLWSGPSLALTDTEQLGKSIFFDDNLSINKNQSCAACHAPEMGWTGPDSVINAGGAVYSGSITADDLLAPPSNENRFGNRKPPSSAYATPSPVLHFVDEKANNENKTEALFIGGNFWDGRATGETLGNPAAEQAQGPFLNPVEQALPGPAEVISRICGSSYVDSFTQVCGTDACDTSDPANVSAAYDCVGLSVAAYEGSPEVNQYTSKYDAFLAGTVGLRTNRCQRSNSTVTNKAIAPPRSSRPRMAVRS